MYWTVICWSIFIVKESHHQKPIYFQEQINMLRKYYGKIDYLIYEMLLRLTLNSYHCPTTFHLHVVMHILD